MTQDQALALMMALGAIVLVASGLVARRLPQGRIWKLALLWLGIFAALFLIVRSFPNLVRHFT